MTTVDPRTVSGLAPDIDTAGIEQVCRDYVESWYGGEVSRMESVLHPELAKRFVRRFPSGVEFLEEIGASKLIEWTASDDGSTIPAIDQRSSVTVLDSFSRAAMAKTVSAWGAEYLQLGKFGHEWKIINILSESRVGGPSDLPLCLPCTPDTEGLPAVADHELEAIDRAVRDYGEGWCTGDATRMARVTHPQWSKKGLRLSRPGRYFLESWGAEKMIGWTSSAEHKATAASVPMRITVLDQDGQIAAARLAWEVTATGKFPKSVDYLAFAKTRGNWQAVNITWEDDRSEGDPDLSTDQEDAWQW